jgi:hypothetical protein
LPARHAASTTTASTPRVGHEITVVIVKSAAIRRGELLPFGSVPTADGDEGCVRQALYYAAAG